MQKENINQLTSSRSVGMRDINAILVKCHSKLDLESHPILLRNDEILNQVQGFFRTSSTFPLEGEGAPSTWRERAECVSTGVRGMLSRAFTLIELLVVILIIGILAAIAIPQYQSAVDKSRIIALAAYAKSIENAQHLYFLANGEYADTLEKLNIPPINSAVEVRPSYNPNRLHIFGSTYLPDILLIYDYGNYKRCLAKDTNARAQAACLRFCNARSAWLDGAWRVCNVL